MKFRYFIFALLVSAGVITAFTSCRSNGNPTSPWSAIFTRTFTISPTPTITGTSTNTVTTTPTDSPTNLPTATPSSTPTYSPTNVPTATPSDTPSRTPTGVPTNTPSDTPTNVPTDTPTGTPTITETGTPTGTPTSTPTSSPTPSYTGTPTASSTPTATNGPCTVLLNGCESLDENGNWKNTTGGTISLSTTGATQGTNALDVNITTGSGWNQCAALDGFLPRVFTTAIALVVDVNADASLITNNGGWCQLVLQCNSGNPFATGSGVAVATGQQSITYTISPSVPATVTSLEFIYQSGGTPTGHLYIDNIRVLYSSCPPTQPAAIQGWNFEGNSLTDSTGTWILETGTGGNVGNSIQISAPGRAGSSYCMSVTALFTGINQFAGAEITFGPPYIDGSSFSGIRCYAWLDSACSNGFPGFQIQLGDGPGGNYPQSSWANAVKGGWGYFEYPASSWGTFNKNTISMIKLQMSTGGSGSSFATGQMKFDNVEFY